MSIRSQICDRISTYQYIMARTKCYCEAMGLVDLANFDALILGMFEKLEKNGIAFSDLYRSLLQLPLFDMIHAISENPSVSDLRRKALLETIVKLDYLLRAMDTIVGFATGVNPIIFFSKNATNTDSVVSNSKITNAIAMYITYKPLNRAMWVHGFAIDKTSKIAEKRTRVIDAEPIIDLVFREFFLNSPFTMKTIESFRR